LGTRYGIILACSWTTEAKTAPTSTGQAARQNLRHGGTVYQKPKVERFGTFRELTRVGFNGTTDGFTICGVNGGTGNELCGAPNEPICRNGSPVT
jgi:hypothetical protein